LYNSPAFSKNSFWTLLVFFIFSLLFHAAFITLIPNFLAIKRIEIIPVIYRKPMEVRIRKLPPLPSRPSEVQKKNKPSVNKRASQFIVKKAQSISVGKGLFLPPPSIQLPVSEVLDGQEKIEELYASNKKNLERLGKYPLTPGVPNLLPETSSEPMGLPPSQIEQAFNEKLVKEIIHGVRSESEKLARIRKVTGAEKKRIPNVKLGVEGPISERRILYKPPLQKIVSEHSVQIKLKFWVTPNGIVDQIIPVERGGTKLESVAIRFLKEWRFDPLPANVKQERQWGILTVKFFVK